MGSCSSTTTRPVGSTSRSKRGTSSSTSNRFSPAIERRGPRPGDRSRPHRQEARFDRDLCARAQDRAGPGGLSAADGGLPEHTRPRLRDRGRGDRQGGRRAPARRSTPLRARHPLAAGLTLRSAPPPAARPQQLRAVVTCCGRRSTVQIGVDIGGTFTDIVALDREGRLVLTKVPTTPKDLLDGIAAAVRRILALTGAAPGSVERFIHGTTVATNAVLEQKGAVTAILTTEGFEDVLELGRQKRSRMYELEMDVETPTFLAPRRRRLGVRERLDARGAVLVPLDEDQVRAEVAALRAQGVQAVA